MKPHKKIKNTFFKAHAQLSFERKKKKILQRFVLKAKVDEQRENFILTFITD